MSFFISIRNRGSQSTRMILKRFGILLNLVTMIWQQIQSGLLQVKTASVFHTREYQYRISGVLIGAASFLALCMASSSVLTILFIPTIRRNILRTKCISCHTVCIPVDIYKYTVLAHSNWTLPEKPVTCKSFQCDFLFLLRCRRLIPVVRTHNFLH